MSWLETKYVHLLSPTLLKFKKVGKSYNCRCPLCNDSKKSKNKARGWIYTEKDPFFFKCYNCGAFMSFPDFLKQQNQMLYYDYVKEKMFELNLPKEEIKVKTPKPVFTKDPFKNLVKISDLSDRHEAKTLLTDRKIPPKFFFDLYYAPDFKDFVNSCVPGKYPEITEDEPRIIIPFRDKEGIIGFQGRSILESEAKYITIVLDEDKPRFYGLDRIDPSKKVYVFEGPIDAMFIENGIASGGGKIERDLALTSLKKSSIVLVYDNEARSKHTIQKLDKAIKSGYQVCIWPVRVTEKDVNDMILAGCSSREITDIIDTGTCRGLTAELALGAWKKI